MPTHYGTLSDALVYHTALGNAAWGDSAPSPMPEPAPDPDPSWHTDAERTAALERASAVLDGRYGARFPGHRTGGRSQVREWPRAGAVDQCADEAIPDDEVPQEIEQAAYELALRELLEPGVLSPGFAAGRVAKREKAGQVEVEYFGAGAGTGEDQIEFPIEVDRLLRCLLTPASAAHSGWAWA